MVKNSNMVFFSDICNAQAKTNIKKAFTKSALVRDEEHLRCFHQGEIQKTVEYIPLKQGC